MATQANRSLPDVPCRLPLRGKFLDLRALTEADLPELLALCQGNPQYYAPMRICPTLENLRESMLALPSGQTMEQKLFAGLFDGEGKLCAVLDLIERYPRTDTVFIGWFMLRRDLQGRGVGSEIIQALGNMLGQRFAKARLGYVRGNEQSRRFWTKNGFAPTGAQYDTDGYTVVVMERALREEKA